MVMGSSTSAWPRAVLPVYLAAWEAQRLYHLLQFPYAQSTWKFNQRLKYSLISSPWGGGVFFLGSFFAMGGWRDGSIGFAFCLLKASYFTQIACRLRELENNTSLPPVSWSFAFDYLALASLLFMILYKKWDASALRLLSLSFLTSEIYVIFGFWSLMVWLFIDLIHFYQLCLSMFMI